MISREIAGQRKSSLRSLPPYSQGQLSTFTTSRGGCDYQTFNTLPRLRKMNDNQRNILVTTEKEFRLKGSLVHQMRSLPNEARPQILDLILNITHSIENDHHYRLLTSFFYISRTNPGNLIFDADKTLPD